jgi:hypothetical protein
MKFRIVRGIESTTIISGAIIGSAFYIIGFPMLVWTYVEPLTINYTFDSMTEILPMFLNTLSIVLAFSIVVGAIMGALGAWLSSKLTNRIRSKVYAFND